MAWDTERTKQLLLDAATVEFSTHGLSGARVDRIAAGAGVNKERIYQYFGNKEKLFGIVLTTELTKVTGQIDVVGSGIEAIVDFAQRLFDYHCANPAYSRLLFWEGLELGLPVNEPDRSDRSRGKAETLRTALPALSAADARELLQTIVTLCLSWQVLPNLDLLITSGCRTDPARLAEHRSFIATTIRGATTALTTD